jgi:biotin carboxylase
MIMAPHVLAIGDLRPAHRQLVALGARLTLLIPANRLQIKDLGLYQRIIVVPATAPVEEWVAFAKALHAIDPVDAIGGFQELLQDTAAIVATALGLPFHPLEVIQATRQKDLMRRTLQDAGVDPTPNARVCDAGEVARFATAHGYPLILKPVDGSASRGVSIIRTTEEIEPAITWCQAGTQATPMLVEPFLAGEEFSVETLSEEGVHRIICITRKYKEAAHFIELGHCLPAIVDAATGARIYRVVDQALTALGLRFGPAHTEIMVCAHQVFVVETQARLAGDHIFDLIRAAYDIDLIDLWARQTLGERVLERLPTPLVAPLFAAIWYAAPHNRGVIVRFEGEEAARALPDVLKVKTIIEPGMALSALQGSSTRPAYAIATGISPEAAVDRAQAAIGQLRVVIAE